MAGSKGTGSTVYSQLDGRQRQHSKSGRLDGRETSVLVVDKGTGCSIYSQLDGRQRQHIKSPWLGGREASVLVVDNGYKCDATHAVSQHSGEMGTSPKQAIFAQYSVWVSSWIAS
jgi:hypothetical protein